jgi:ribosomal protein L37AE/L43A
VNDLRETLMSIARAPNLCEHCLTRPRQLQIESGEWICNDCNELLQDDKREYDEHEDDEIDPQTGFRDDP